MSAAATPTLRELLREAGEILADRLEAELLLAHAISRTRTYLHTWPEEPCAADEAAHFRGLVERRRQGEPVAYLLGHREFWSLDLKVTPDTLIPRPETEHLVELALERIPKTAEWRLADLGTGSGAIGLVLARERPRCHVVATERSQQALAIARENAERHGLTNVTLRLGDWWDPLAGERFQLVVSNPPYVPDADSHLSRGDLTREPRTALAAGTDGLDALRNIIAGAPDHLFDDGYLLLEHGYDQGNAVRALLQAVGMVEIETCQDLAANDRVTLGRYMGERDGSGLTTVKVKAPTGV